MGQRSSKVKATQEEIAAGLFPPEQLPRNDFVKSTPEQLSGDNFEKPTRIISLDGNIGVGKTTLLKTIRERFPDIVIVEEPVDVWTTLKDADGKNLLELFYGDKRRWAFSFQQAAMLSRLLLLQRAVLDAKPGQIILSERSVLTDRFVFAEMLYRAGDLTELEWTLYQHWYHAFGSMLPMAGILYINTSVDTAYARIQSRGRSGEGEISKEYLQALDKQHRAWIATTQLQKQEISTEEGTDVEATVKSITEFLNRL
jgi:deoxycitidine kinase/deoxyguanosine kinase